MNNLRPSDWERLDALGLSPSILQIKDSRKLMPLDVKNSVQNVQARNGVSSTDSDDSIRRDVYRHGQIFRKGRSNKHAILALVDGPPSSEMLFTLISLHDGNRMVKPMPAGALSDQLRASNWHRLPTGTDVSITTEHH